MRLNYYQFPDDISEDILLQEGCEIILHDGSTIYSDCIPEEKRPLVKYIDRTLGGISLTRAKLLMKKYGGTGWIEHIDRDGGCFEVSEIKIKGYNSRYKYNRHL